MKKIFTTAIGLLFAFLSLANVEADYSKLSAHLVGMLQRDTTPSVQKIKGENTPKYIMALVSLAISDESVFDEYNCKIEDTIGRIYIVNIPFQQLSALSLDRRIERIEAERMPRPAMDKTHSRVNANDVYKGTDLPQAFSGEGVIAGIFDCFYDFTHPAFFDEEGNTRIKYYYDMRWPNEDGTLGNALETPEEILAHQYSKNTYNTAHGTHVAGIMAGSSVDGKYAGVATKSDIFLADFNSDKKDFENPDSHTSATAVLGFKYLFDRAEEEGKPCVINFSSCESITLSQQRILEGEALEELVGPGRIIVAAAGNMGHQIPYMEKPAEMNQAGAAIINGIGGAKYILMDIITPANQKVRFDFWGIKLVEANIEASLTFNTDSIKSLGNEPCILKTQTSQGDIELKITNSDYLDPRGDVFHIEGLMPNEAFLMLCGATFLLTSDSPAWLYSDLFYSPFANLEGIPEYSCTNPGYSVSWPATLPFIVAVGATGYETNFQNIWGETNTDIDFLAADSPGKITKFSSLGPTFDGLIKPDVVAPGMHINAAYNSFSSAYETDKKSLTDKVTFNGKDYYYMAQSGTSMASPVVAGIVALWLEAVPTLTPQQILDVIAKTSTIPDDTLQYPNNTYGYGQIDAYKGLLYLLDVYSSIPTIHSHQPLDARFHLSETTLRIAFENSDYSDENLSVSIYSINGTKVYSGHDTTIEISHLPEGIYAVQLNTSNPNTTGSTLIRIR